MKKTDLIKLIEKLGIAPSKKLGQNFLIEPRIIQNIVAAAELTEKDIAVEIGPGLGSMTNIPLPTISAIS